MKVDRTPAPKQTQKANLMLGARGGHIFVKMILPTSRWLETFCMEMQGTLGFTSMATGELSSLKGAFKKKIGEEIAKSSCLLF